MYKYIFIYYYNLKTWNINLKQEILSLKRNSLKTVVWGWGTCRDGWAVKSIYWPGGGDYKSVLLHFYMDVGELNLALTWTQQALYWAISLTPNVSLSVCCSHPSPHQCTFWEQKHQHFSLSGSTDSFFPFLFWICVISFFFLFWGRVVQILFNPFSTAPGILGSFAYNHTEGYHQWKATFPGEKKWTTHGLQEAGERMCQT